MRKALLVFLAVILNIPTSAYAWDVMYMQIRKNEIFIGVIDSEVGRDYMLEKRIVLSQSDMRDLLKRTNASLKKPIKEGIDLDSDEAMKILIAFPELVLAIDIKLNNIKTHIYMAGWC